MMQLDRRSHSAWVFAPPHPHRRNKPGRLQKFRGARFATEMTENRGLWVIGRQQVH